MASGEIDLVHEDQVRARYCVLAKAQLIHCAQEIGPASGRTTRRVVRGVGGIKDQLGQQPLTPALPT